MAEAVGAGLAGLGALASYTSGAAVPLETSGSAASEGPLPNPYPEGYLHIMNNAYYHNGAQGLLPSQAATTTVVESSGLDGITPSLFHNLFPVAAAALTGTALYAAYTRVLQAHQSPQEALEQAKREWQQAWQEFSGAYDQRIKKIAKAAEKFIVKTELWSQARLKRNKQDPNIEKAITAVNEALKNTTQDQKQALKSLVEIVHKKVTGNEAAEILVQDYCTALDTVLKARAVQDQQNSQGAQEEQGDGLIMIEAEVEVNARFREAEAQLFLAEAALYGHQMDEDEARRLQAARNELDILKKEGCRAHKKWKNAWQDPWKEGWWVQYYQERASFYKVKEHLHKKRADFFRTLPKLYTELTKWNQAQAKIYDLVAESGQASATLNQAIVKCERVVRQHDDVPPFGS